LVLALAAGGCVAGEAIPGVTGVELVIVSDEALGLDALELEGTAEGRIVFPETTLPDPPRPLAPSGESVLILVDDTLGGKRLELEVDAMAGGVVMTEATLRIDLVGGELVAVPVELAARCGRWECECRDGSCDCDEKMMRHGCEDDDD
jgi:hypothetical protein